MLITHFGLTAFEALHAGVPVLLVSPGPYHQRLARAAGFVSAGVGVRAVRRLRKLLSGNWRDLRETCRSLARRHNVSGESKTPLAGLISALRPEFLPRRCPCCGDSGAALHPVAARFPNRIFRRCPCCGVIYLGRIDESPIEYEKAYFFEFYKAQYGKTYIEDFPNLIAMAEQRLSRILPLLAEFPGTKFPSTKFPGARTGTEFPGTRTGAEGSAPKLLDIGCAYGAFLLAASRSGFDVRGLDPAEDATAYVRDTLKLPALRSFFPPEQNGEGFFIPGSFSAITLWYVIEHFADPAAALEEIRRLLKDGGALAFSTPSFSGISGKKSLKTFLERSPGDHWTIWSPRICRRILKSQGFSVRKTVVTGHHPERFPLLGRFCKTKGPAYRFLHLLSRILRLGDTFEVYAIKNPAKGRVTVL
jgi:2-polyprenyl-3-methyl-5-hydroxy-6-metoxy-1,4-benzoquinol methylase